VKRGVDIAPVGQNSPRHGRYSSLDAAAASSETPPTSRTALLFGRRNAR
jgi:hypothetical protein